MKAIRWVLGIVPGWWKILLAVIVGGVLWTYLKQAYNYVWVHPENLNGYARQYVAKIGELTSTVTNLVRDTTGYKATIAQKDSIIIRRDSTIVVLGEQVDTLQREAKKSVELGQQFKGMYYEAVSLANTNADKLTAEQANTAYYRQLVSFGELSPILPITTLNLGSPETVKAGVKLGIKVEEGEKAMTTASTAIGRLTSANRRLNTGVAGATQTAQAMGQVASKGLTGFPILRAGKTRAALKMEQAKADSLAKVLKDMMALENELNPK